MIWKINCDKLTNRRTGKEKLAVVPYGMVKITYPPISKTKFTLLALWSVLAWAGTSNPTGTTCGSLTGGAAPGNIAAGFIARFAYKTTIIINGNF